MTTKEIADRIAHLIIVALVFFWLGWWLAPNDPPKVEQVMNCAGFDNTEGDTHNYVTVFRSDGSVAFTGACKT